MLIILGSKNPSKKRSVEMALTELEINDFDILCLDSASGVDSKPIGYELLRGADNRNQASKKYAEENEIAYDYLCAIEGGFTIDEMGHPFVVTYAIMEDNQGNKSTGKSLGIRIRKDVFDFIQQGGSVNSVIGEITGQSNNKQLQGIMGYLTNGLFTRDVIDKQAVMSALIPLIFKENRDNLSKHIKRKKLKK